MSEEKFILISNIRAIRKQIGREISTRLLAKMDFEELVSMKKLLLKHYCNLIYV